MKRSRRAAALLTLLAALGAADAATAQARYRSASAAATPPQARSLPENLETYRRNASGRLLVDFGQQYVYAAANAALPPPARGEQRVVFLGDSITDFWDLTKSFPGKPYVNRGINGQVTPQMLLRFHVDVAALKPSAVVILAGVNDVSGVLQTLSQAQTEANYEALAELAIAHGVTPIFAKILPINRFNQASNSQTDRDPAPLAQLNAWLEAFCRAHGYVLIDYGPALSGPDGQLQTQYSVDGLHPNDAGYAVMAPIAAKAIAGALASRAAVSARPR